MRVPWSARKSSQFILKEINPEHSSEGLMLKLKFQYFGHLMQTANSLDKTQMLGKTEGKRRRGRQRMRWLDSITDSVDVNLGKLRESEGQAWCAAVHGVMDSWTQLHDSTATGQISLIQPLASFHNFVANIYHFFVFEGLCLLKPHNYHLMQF